MKAKRNLYQVALGILLALAPLTALLASPGRTAQAQQATPIPTTNSNTTIAVSIANPAVQPGDAFDVSITISSDTPSRGAQAEVTFDPKLVQVVGVSEGDFYKTWAKANKGNTIMQPSKPNIDNQKGHVPLVGVAVIGGTVGQGPAGTGSLFILHVKAQPGASGAATFALDNLIVSDVGDQAGNTSALGGVKVQNGAVSVGGQAVAQPTAAALTALPPTATFVEATVVRRGTAAPVTLVAGEAQSGGSGGSLSLVLIAVPVLGAVVIGGGAVVMLRRRK